jgi:hypothetical protein
LNPNQAVNPGVTSADAHLHTPYYQSWNIAVQRSLPAAISLELAYAGSKGTHLQSVTDPNQVLVPGPEMSSHGGRSLSSVGSPQFAILETRITTRCK